MKLSKQITMTAITILASLTFTGCSNDNDESTIELNQDKNVLSNEVLSTEELLKTGTEDFTSWQTSEDALQTRAVSSTLFTIYGCSSQKGGGNYKYMIPTDISNVLGIPRAIYVVENVTCYTEIKIDGLGTTKFFSPASSPLCGIMPGGSNFTRGYTNTTPDSQGKIIFSTLLIHIISDMSGRNYDMWYPCNPTNIEWKYNLIQ